MARKDDAPAISLFSFQDIITSLTGIMFLIVLLLILFMLEMRPKEKQEEARKERRLLSETRTELKLMRERLSALQKNEAKLDRQIAALQQQDMETIRRDLELTQSELDDTRRESVLLQEIIRKAKKQSEEDSAHAERLRRENRALEQAVLKEQKQLSDLRSTVRSTRLQEQQRKQVIRYTVENASALSPVLVECAKNGFHLLYCATGKQVDLTQESGSSEARRQVFLDYLGKHDTQGEYYTILIKPETFEDAVLVDELKARGIARGLEFLPFDELTIFGGQ